MESTLRVCAVMGCIMTEALEVRHVPHLIRHTSDVHIFHLPGIVDSMCVYVLIQQKKSIHIPFRSKYNRVTKRARYLHENPSCLLCNILHRYLQQADYSVIEEATMVRLYAFI